MAVSKAKFSWRSLYQAKLNSKEKEVKESVDRLAILCKEVAARKQSRQIKRCEKIPSGFKKRNFCGAFGDSSTFSNVKSSIMKKAKAEYKNSVEMKNVAAMRKGVVQQQRSNSAPRHQIVRGKGIGSYTKFAK